MFYCGNLNSLIVLSLYEGDLLGKVDKLYFDKKLKKLIEIEIIGENDMKFYLLTKNIYNVGKNAITIKNNQMLSLVALDCEKVCVPIGSKAYSINGEFLGVVQEVALNEKFLTEKICLENDVVLGIDNLATLGKNTIIFQAAEDKINIKNFMPSRTPTEFKSKEVEIAKIMPIETSVGAVSVEENKNQNIQSLDFLVGRTCTVDIYNFNHEILIKANSVVTKKHLKEVNKYSKLRELMLYIK